MVKWRVHVDTVSISRRAMKVEAPDRSDELIDAVIRDPAFDIDPDHNIYTDSLGEDLIIEAKPTYRAGTKELVKLHVMNAERASTP